jgi:hypothetical protein
MFSALQRLSGFGIIVLLVQTLFGAWYLVHGLNYFFDFFEQPTGGDLIPALIRTGLFAWVKIAEIVVGALLLAHCFVPLAIAAAVPITVVIAYLNLVLSHSRFGHGVGIIVLSANAIMALGYWDRYRPMLAFDSGVPRWRGLLRDPTPAVSTR